MAISFAGTAGDNVNHGSGASLDNLTTLTQVLWIYPKATGQNAGLVAKGTGGAGSRRSLEFRNTAGPTRIFATVDRATSDATAETADSAYSANAWIFIAMVYDGTNGIKLYTGTLTSLAVEVTYAAGQPVTGSGAEGDNSAANQFVCAFGAGTSGNPNANIGWVGIWNRVLTLGEIQQQQYRQRKTDGCVLFTHYGIGGTGTQPDWSGSGNTGTITGGSGAIDHMPLGGLFGVRTRRGYVVAAVTGNPWYAYAQQ